MIRLGMPNISEWALLLWVPILDESALPMLVTNVDKIFVTIVSKTFTVAFWTLMLMGVLSHFRTLDLEVSTGSETLIYFCLRSLFSLSQDSSNMLLEPEFLWSVLHIGVLDKKAQKRPQFLIGQFKERWTRFLFWKFFSWRFYDWRCYGFFY